MNQQVRTVINVELTNVSREEQQGLRDYLEEHYWKWSEEVLYPKK